MASDGDMHFPPGQRREKPTFEPPPWEKDRFDDLAKQRQEAEAAQKLLEVEEPVEPSPEAAEALAEEPLGVAEQPEPEADEEQAEAGEAKPELDPKHVELLMMGLRSEEPRAEDTYWKITTAAGVASALIGLLLTTGGLVAMATPKRPGAGPMLFVTLLMLFGIGFIVGGVWVVINALRQRGVL
jgi:hypothetical protein